MPVIGWKCPVERIEVPFDHFDHCTARKGRPAFSPWLARAMAQKIENDVRHKTLQSTATRIMGCPRQVYIETVFSYYANPQGKAVPARGTFMHEHSAGYWNPEIYATEKSDPVRATLAGVIGGREVSMLMDVWKKDLTEIIDSKFPMDFSVRFRTPDAKKEHAVQLNLARLLLAQQDWAKEEGYDEGKVLLTIWDHAMGKSEGPIPQVAPHMSEEEILKHQPFGGDATVEEIWDCLEWAKEQHEGGPPTLEHHEQVAASLPLVGETMMRRKGASTGVKCTQYCESEPICTDLVKRFGRPEEGEGG